MSGLRARLSLVAENRRCHPCRRWVVGLVAAALLSTACGGDEPRAPIFIVSDCIADADASEACIGAWNNLVVGADPGMRRAMTDYDKCIEAGEWTPFDPDQCTAQMQTLRALLP